LGPLFAGLGFASPAFRVAGGLKGRWKFDEGTGTTAADYKK